MLVVMLVSLYTARVILNTLGVTDYGIYNVVGGVVTVMVFLNSALNASTSRFLTFELGTGNIEKLKKTFSASLNLHICVALLVIIIGETIVLWFFYNKMVIPNDRMTAAFWVYQFSIINTVIAFTQVPYAATLISHEKMSIYAYVGLYEAFSKLVIAYLVTVSPIDKLILYALLLMLNSAAIQLFYRVYTKRKFIECRFRLVKEKSLYINLLRYSGWDLFGGLSAVCQNQGINIVLNLFFGPIVNAARAIAIQIQAAIDGFVTNFLLAARPQVIKNYAEGETKKMYDLSFSSAKFAFFLMFALIVPVCLELDFILKIWLGDVVPDYTRIFTLIILLTALIQTIHKASLMPYHAIGRIKIGNIIGGSIMILSLPISYILFKMGFQPYWAFIVIFLTNSVQQFITWYIINRYVKLEVRKLVLGVYLPCIVVSVLTLVPVLLIKKVFSEGWIQLIVVACSTETILMVLIFFIGLTKNERSIAIGFIRNLVHR